MDYGINPEEIKDAINLLKKKRLPGTDGLITEFYKSFANEFVPFLF